MGENKPPKPDLKQRIEALQRQRVQIVHEFGRSLGEVDGRIAALKELAEEAMADQADKDALEKARLKREMRREKLQPVEKPEPDPKPAEGGPTT